VLRLPTLLFRNGQRETALAVECHERRLNVADRGLDLNHQDHRRPRVKGQDVDRATFAEYVERHLRRAQPTVSPEDTDELLDDFGVRSVEQAIEILSMPVDAADQPCAQRRENPVQCGYRDSVATSLLDSGDDTPRHMRLARQILLSPTSTNPQRPDAPTEPDDIHSGDGACRRSSGA
jgi:hypothetical protein